MSATQVIDQAARSNAYTLLADYLKTLAPDVFSQISFPKAMVTVLNQLMGFPGYMATHSMQDGLAISTSWDTKNMIAAVNDIQVTYEKTNPSSGLYAWVVRFTITPANPVGSAAINVRLILGMHETMSLRHEYETVVHDIFRKWLDAAGVPYPPDL